MLKILQKKIQEEANCLGIDSKHIRIIPKKELIPGKIYRVIGDCDTAKWDGNTFKHLRIKISSCFIDALPCYEDVNIETDPCLIPYELYYDLNDYLIKTYPEIYDIVNKPDYEFNVIPLERNYKLGILSGTYLVNKEWFNKNFKK